jgi:hypothetical protein
MSGEPGPPYRVAYPQPILQQVRDWTRGGLGSRFRVQSALAMRIIERTLAAEPLAWGDPLYHLPHLNLLVFEVVCFPFLVKYGVSEEHRLVVVQALRPLLAPDTAP